MEEEGWNSICQFKDKYTRAQAKLSIMHACRVHMCLISWVDKAQSRFLDRSSVVAWCADMADWFVSLCRGALRRPKILDLVLRPGISHVSDDKSFS